MATEPSCFADLVRDADFLVISEMPSSVSSSSSSSSSSSATHEPFLEVKERLSSCEICLERMRGNQLVNKDGSAQALCCDCSKTTELSKEEYCSKGLCIHSSSGNDSANSSTCTACTSNLQVQVKTHQETADIISLNYADMDGDSEASERSDEYRAEKQDQEAQSPKSRLLKKFFMEFEKLTPKKINEPSRIWNCPACEGGSRATKWFQGFQALISHAKTRAGNRTGPHRELAQLLEQKLCGKETFAVPAREMFGKWKGLKQENKDHEIVWPPMVVIRNTSLKNDENQKWIGMSSQKLLELFSAYDCIAKARHVYGSQGHRGMSVLIFEGSARGYLEAERLHNHLADQGTDRNAWHHSPVYFARGGERQLYGYLAVKQDVDLVNQSSRGSSKLKYEMRSYREMVVNGIRKMYKDNHVQLLWLKNWVAQKQMHPKEADEPFGASSERLNQAMKEIQVLRDIINLQHVQHLEEMNLQEQFFKDQMKCTLEARDEKEEDCASTQNEGEEANECVQLSGRNLSNKQENKEQTSQSKKSKGKEKEEIVAEIDKPGGSCNSWYTACQSTRTRKLYRLKEKKEVAAERMILEGPGSAPPSIAWTAQLDLGSCVEV